jgi:hypothetical protein
MEKEFTPGKMVEDMKANINLTKNTDTEYINGQMEEVRRKY